MILFFQDENPEDESSPSQQGQQQAKSEQQQPDQERESYIRQTDDDLEFCQPGSGDRVKSPSGQTTKQEQEADSNSALDLDLWKSYKTKRKMWLFPEKNNCSP